MAKLVVGAALCVSLLHCTSLLPEFCSWELILLGTGSLPPIQYNLWVRENFILVVPDPAGRNISARPYAQITVIGMT